MLNCKRSRPNWSELQPEILELIVSKISFADVQSFKRVCSSWRAAAVSSPSGPLLVVPSTEEGEKTIRLGVFSVRDQKTYDLKLSVDKSENVYEPDYIRFVGSSHGWMVFLDRNAEPYLCNLFSRNCIQLPPKNTIEKLTDSREQEQRTLIHKAILASKPSTQEKYMVAIIHSPCNKLAFCRDGDENWTRFSDSQGYSDIVWSNGMLYALRGGVTIEGWKFSSESRSLPSMKMRVTSSFNSDLSFPSDLCTTRWYLVPSKGEILFIVRYTGEFVSEKGELFYESEIPLPGDQDCSSGQVYPYRAFKFEVYKLDVKAEELVRVRSLKDEVIFVGGNHGISLPAKDHQEFKPNSIYFTDDYWDRTHEDYLYGGHDIGMFSLEDESIGSVYECEFVQRFEPIPFWVLPN